MKLLFLLIPLIVSCGKGGGSSQSAGGAFTTSFKVKQTLSTLVSGAPSIIVEGSCTVNASCTVTGVLYGNDSGPLPLIKMNFTVTLNYIGNEYSGVITPQSACGYTYTLSISDDFLTGSIDYDNYSYAFNSLQSYTNTLAVESAPVNAAPQDCVDAR